MSYKQCFDKLSELLQVDIGLKNCGESESFYYQTLESVVEYVPRKISHLKECVSQSDYEGYIIEVHTLKSNAALIGAMGLSEKAKELEYAGKEKRYELIQVETKPLVEQYETMIGKLKEVLSETAVTMTSSATGFASAMDREQCQEVICEAAEGLGEQRVDYVMNLLELLEIYQMPAQIKKKVEEIQQQLKKQEYIAAYQQLLQLSDEISQ